MPITQQLDFGCTNQDQIWNQANQLPYLRRIHIIFRSKRGGFLQELQILFTLLDLYFKMS